MLTNHICFDTDIKQGPDQDRLAFNNDSVFNYYTY